MKRWICTLLCVCLLAGCLTLGAGAAEPNREPEDSAASAELMAAGGIPGYDPETEALFDFGMIVVSDNATAFAAAYDRSGRLLYFAEPIRSDGHMMLVLPKAVYAEMYNAKLFRLSSEGFKPLSSVIKKLKTEQSDIETPRF